MTIWHEDRLLIDGARVPSSPAGTSTTVDPATETVLGTAADDALDARFGGDRGAPIVGADLVREYHSITLDRARLRARQ